MSEFEKYRPVSVKEFYNKIHHQYYDSSAHHISCQVKSVHEAILRQMRGSVEGVILDVGCASQEPPINTVGCDLSIEGLSLRRKLYPDSSSACADITCLPFKVESFSATLAGLLIDHVENPEEAFISLKRVATPEGQLVLTVFESSKRPQTNYRGDKLHYSTTSGESYSVPSFGWTEKELEQFASSADWQLVSTDHYSLDHPGYRLLRLDFR
jgi:ubiquinone/menaquinone biosynthesis C-methylase UbiE